MLYYNYKYHYDFYQIRSSLLLESSVAQDAILTIMIIISGKENLCLIHNQHLTGKNQVAHSNQLMNNIYCFYRLEILYIFHRTSKF